MKRMNANWYCILDPETDTHDSVRSRSVFLLTAILSVASLFVRPMFSGDKSQDFSEGGLVHAQLAVHAVDLAMSSFADVRSSLETVQAFFVLSTWKDIDDCSSHLRFGFASQLCRDLELSTLAPMEKDMTAERLGWWRARQRMSLAIFIRVRRSRSSLDPLFGRRTVNLISVSSSSTGPDSRQPAGVDAFVAAARPSHLVVVRSLGPHYSTRTSLLPFGS